MIIKKKNKQTSTSNCYLVREGLPDLPQVLKGQDKKTDQLIHGSNRSSKSLGKSTQMFG